MINKTVLVGRITKDIELKKTPNGASVIQFTLAVNRKVKQGQDADFIQCTAWNKTAELMAQYLSKGALVGIDGHIQTRNYDDKDGKKVYITEVIAESVAFLESKKETSETSWNKPQYTPTIDGEDAYETIDIENDALPF